MIKGAEDIDSSSKRRKKTVRMKKKEEGEFDADTIKQWGVLFVARAARLSTSVKGQWQGCEDSAGCFVVFG